MKSPIKHIGMAVAAVAVATGGLLFALSQTAWAATITVNPGDSIQTAINGAANGDTIVITAGTYAETLRLTKPLTLKGQGEVIIQTKSTGASDNKGIDIQNTHNVRLENLIFDGENGDPTAQTGIDINSVNGIVLSNVTAKNYAKNGISVVTQHNASYTTGGNITLDNVTVENNEWSGIAFYPQSTTGYEIDLAGVAFSGTTTVSGNGKAGIQFGDPGDTAKITGVNGSEVDLGTVHFSNNQALILNESRNSSIVLSEDSTIDGRAVTAADFAGLNVTINTSVPIPGVPNTATAQ